MVQPGLTGLLPPFGDVPAWAAALDLLLGSPDLARSWGEAGRRRVTARFSLGAMVEAHQELFDRLLGRMPRRTKRVGWGERPTGSVGSR